MPKVALSTHDITTNSVRCLGNIRSELVGEAIGNVLLIPCVIRVASHRTVEIKRGVRLGHEGAVDWYLVQVDTDTMILSVSVEEHAELEEGIGGVFYAWDHAARGEGGLLDVSMIVLWVFIEHEPTKGLHGELLSRPDFGHIEWVKAKLVWIRLTRVEYLDMSRPLNLLALFNRRPQVLLGVIWVLTADLCCLWVGKLLLSMLGNEMVLDVDKAAILIDPLEGVATISVVETPALRSSVIAEEHETGVVTLGGVGE